MRKLLLITFIKGFVKAIFSNNFLLLRLPSILIASLEKDGAIIKSNIQKAELKFFSRLEL